MNENELKIFLLRYLDGLVAKPGIEMTSTLVRYRNRLAKEGYVRTRDWKTIVKFLLNDTNLNAVELRERFRPLIRSRKPLNKVSVEETRSASLDAFLT